MHIQPIESKRPPDADTSEWRNRHFAQLIQQARSGDILAFDALYSGTVGWLLGRIRRLVSDGHAEDILAEVYLQVWRTLASFDESRGPAAVWLAMIARSRVYDHLRREKRISERATQAAEFEALHTDGPEQILTREQEARLLRLFISSLSSQERLVLGLAYFNDYSQQEIATRTGLPVVRVRLLLGRALQKLRLQFGTPSRRQVSLGAAAAAQ